MTIKIYDKPSPRQRRKESISYTTNKETGYLEMVRTYGDVLPDPKNIANDFLVANKNRLPYFRIISKYDDAIEIEILSDFQEAIDTLETNGFDHEAEGGIPLSELSGELGVPNEEVFRMAKGMFHLKTKRSVLDEKQADAVRSEFFRMQFMKLKQQRGEHLR